MELHLGVFGKRLIITYVAVKEEEFEGRFYIVGTAHA
jgi:hypothetical protein